MTLKEIANEWFDKTVPYPIPDPDNLQGQCVQFIRYLLKVYYKTPQWEKQIGASHFWNSYDTDPKMYLYFDKIKNTPDFIPQEGDLVFWNTNKGGGYGHTAAVYGKEQTVNMLTTIESNWKPYKVSIVTHNYNDVIGFLRPKNRVE
jgi:hypothetical protein